MTIFHGRGASANPTGRFQKETTTLDPGEESAAGTEFLADHSRSILAENDSPDIPFRFSVNPYRGCEHGCIYCYARPTHEYLGLSAGLDFESKIFVKEEAPALLRKALLRPGYLPETVNISGVTDCYQPIEREKQLTRGCLEVLGQFGNPFTVITKNRLVTRDIDLIAPMAARNAAAVFVSVTSLDANLAARLEPRASRPEARLAAIRALSEAGIPTGVMVAPVVPALTDSEMPQILEAAYEAGARYAGFTLLRLPLGVEALFSAWLEDHYPDRKERVLSRIRDLRGGALNSTQFHARMKGEGPFAALLSQLFRNTCSRLGMNRRKLELTAGHFRRPGEQLALF